MRQGPDYNQWVDRNDKDEISIRLPLELEEEWKNAKSVLWRDNGDGTYTLVPNNEV